MSSLIERATERHSATSWVGIYCSLFIALKNSACNWVMELNFMAEFINAQCTQPILMNSHIKRSGDCPPTLLHYIKSHANRVWRFCTPAPWSKVLKKKWNLDVSKILVFVYVPAYLCNRHIFLVLFKKNYAIFLVVTNLCI